MEIIPYGDTALLIQFEDVISPTIHKKVLSYYQSIQQHTMPALLSCTPAYTSLLVYYNNQQTTFTNLRQQLLTLPIEQHSSKNAKTLVVPVCYENSFALDMALVCQQKKLTSIQVINLHKQHTYRVYMLGFLPGFAYLGSLPESLHCARKSTPRLQVPQGAVGIAGAQTGIYPSISPGGWQIIGQTPIRMFDPNQAQPFLVEAGDSIRFEAISNDTYQSIQQAVHQQKWEPVYE